MGTDCTTCQGNLSTQKNYCKLRIRTGLRSNNNTFFRRQSRFIIRIYINRRLGQSELGHFQWRNWNWVSEFRNWRCLARHGMGAAPVTVNMNDKTWLSPKQIVVINECDHARLRVKNRPKVGTCFWKVRKRHYHVNKHFVLFSSCYFPSLVHTYGGRRVVSWVWHISRHAPHAPFLNHRI